VEKQIKKANRNAEEEAEAIEEARLLADTLSQSGMKTKEQLARSTRREVSVSITGCELLAG
jgi:hypothetical protein